MQARHTTATHACHTTDVEACTVHTTAMQARHTTATHACHTTAVEACTVHMPPMQPCGVASAASGRKGMDRAASGRQEVTARRAGRMDGGPRGKQEREMDRAQILRELRRRAPACSSPPTHAQRSELLPPSPS
eukprot:350974-Chlamydomonas_euryale.AAC.1